MTPEQRIEVLAERRNHELQSHSPAHFESESTSHYLITAAVRARKGFRSGEAAAVNMFIRVQ